MLASTSVRKVNNATVQKVISIETKKCCACGKTLQNKSDQFALNDKQVVCSACWDVPQANPFGKSATQPTLSLVHFPNKD
jgi:recombinational DNA repair protein (RecF pathway)